MENRKMTKKLGIRVRNRNSLSSKDMELVEEIVAKKIQILGIRETKRTGNGIVKISIVLLRSKDRK